MRKIYEISACLRIHKIPMKNQDQDQAVATFLYLEIVFNNALRTFFVRTVKEFKILTIYYYTTTTIYTNVGH